MKNKILSLFLAVAFIVAGQDAFAIDAVNCPGEVSGIFTGGNVNVGKTYLDGESQAMAAFGILGIDGAGLAPSDSNYAACVSPERGVYKNVAYDHRIKGVAWNDNLGFISFSCEDGRYNSGGVENIGCGPFDYGVYVSEANQLGMRTLHGYAWSAALGYLKFDTDAFPAYRAKVGVDGSVSGYAFTNAGIWVDVSGMNLELAERVVLAGEEGEEEPIDPELELGDWCDGRPFFCAEVTPEPGSLSFALDADSDLKVADGEDGYNIHLFFNDENGDPISDDDVEDFIESLEFAWDDTVKKDQTGVVAVGDSLDGMSRPWSEGNGAVRFKPVSGDDFERVAPGHYVTEVPISSFAPTSESNVSFTHATTPPYPFFNEQFLNNVEEVPLEREANNLVLKWISHGPFVIGGEEVAPGGSISLEGINGGVSFKFRPALEVNELYANSEEDTINAYRGIENVIHTNTAEYGDLPEGTVDDATVSYHLAYDRGSPEMQSQDCSLDSFEVYFVNDFEGEDVRAAVPTALSADFDDLLNGDDVQAVADLPPIQEGEEELDLLPCQYAQAPSLYTKVHYSVDGQDVVYYSNKLPKTPGRIANPSIVVHGNIYGQDLGNVSAQNRTQISGNIGKNVIRDTINTNLERFNVASLSAGRERELCTVNILKSGGRHDVSGCTREVVYKYAKVGDEDVLYFKGADVVMDLQEGASVGKWVVIADDGNVFIDNSINNNDSRENRMTLVALRGERYGDNVTGHGYLAGGKAMVVDATLIFDGTLFAYDGVNKNAMDDDGVPQWDNQAARQEALAYQALIRGVLYSDNTIGGADLDGGEDPKDYLLAGGGTVLDITQENRQLAQSYDLNYLRLFNLDVERCEDGSPVDQVCGRCLSSEDMLAIAQGERLCGAKGEETCEARVGNLYMCNGINPFEKYNGSPLSVGDLVAPSQPEKMVSSGLDNHPQNGSQFDPVYIFFRAPDKESFVFGG